MWSIIIKAFLAIVYKKYCLELAGDLGHDLYHEVVLYLCEKSEEQKNQLLNSSWYLFVIQIIYNTYYLPRSPFNKKFNPSWETVGVEHVEFIDEEYNQEQDLQDTQRIESIKEKMSKLEWYEGVIFQIHLEGESMKKISRDTQIPYNSVRATIRNVKNKLK